MRRRPSHRLLGLLLTAGLAGPAAAQCILANPSFELGGSGGSVFGGWNQFGVVGQSTDASHGGRAVRVSGPNAGGWDVSGFWQSQDTAPGERWAVTGHVRHPAANPLTGACTALSSPTDTYLDFSLLSGPAPAGAATARLLLGVLQSPTAPSPDVVFDEVTFYGDTAPTIDDVQWNDFPGGKTLDFAGRTWRVKGPGIYGPGTNYFCDSSQCVWVDAADRLHLTVRDLGSLWTSTEVVADEALGYGDYVVTTRGRLDLLDPQVVFGIFPWQYGTCWDDAYLWWNPYNEIDIEYSRWGNPAADLVQFVAQPYDYPGNLDRFDVAFGTDEQVSHAMRWLADRVEYRVWRGGPLDESAANTLHAWTYTGPHIPRPDQPRLHLNLWKLGGTPAGNQEVVIESFRFVPTGDATAANDPAPPAAPPFGRIRAVTPNPFNPLTTVRFQLTRAGHAELHVYDLSGRHVRRLAAERFESGEHRVEWNGLNDGGLAVPSGVYLIRLQGEGFVESRRAALVR